MSQVKCNFGDGETTEESKNNFLIENINNASSEETSITPP